MCSDPMDHSDMKCFQRSRKTRREILLRGKKGRLLPLPVIPWILMENELLIEHAPDDGAVQR